MNCKSNPVRIVTPYPLTRKLVIKQPDAGKTVLNLLTERFPYIDKYEWLKRIANNRIHINGNRANPDLALNHRDLLEHFNPRVCEPSVPDSVSVVKESENWMVVYKPAPMPVHQGGRYYKNTLTYILSEMGYKGLKPIHRLDAVTSGLILFAKNKTTALQLSKQFMNGVVNKQYYALCYGKPNFYKLTIDQPIRRKNGFIFECCPSTQKDAKRASTQLEVMEYHSGKSLIKCTPLTGRTHQIRLHLNYCGLPIADDPIYGPNGDNSGNRLQNSSISLLSSGIEIGESEISVQLSPPDWLHSVNSTI